jgi:organic hydroperoxide reductase OsmC/OhrA
MDAGAREYRAAIAWQRHDEPFIGGRYSRAHQWQFDGGAVVPASSSPKAVPAPFSDPEAVDPGEALVAALSSSHMLFFLAFAAKRHWVIERYADEAAGYMEKNAAGKWFMARVVLRPAVVFAGEMPAQTDIDDLHREAQEECYLANSVRAELVIEPA